MNILSNNMKCEWNMSHKIGNDSANNRSISTTLQLNIITISPKSNGNSIT